MRPTRRGVIQGLGGMLGIGSLGLLSPLTRAESLIRDDRYFLFCFFNGGWDLLLGLDPRDPAQFTSELVPSTGIELAYDQVNGIGDELIETGVDGLSLGPAIGELSVHASKLAVVRGASMETLDHVAGRRYFYTGKAPAGQVANGSSMATWLAAQTGSSQALPNLVFHEETYNVDQASFASGVRVSSVGDLQRLLSPGDYSLSEEEMEQIDAFLLEQAEGAQAQRSPLLTNATNSYVGSRDALELNLADAFELTANTDEMRALRDHHGVDIDDLGAAPAQGAAAVMALTQGMSRCVTIQAATSLDTHDGNWGKTQGTLQEGGWNVVARVISDLASREYQNTGESWLDHTTIVCGSEFGRAGVINSNGGRDHNILGAWMLCGAGIRPGVYGASTDVAYMPYAMNLETGLPDAAGEVVRPNHMLRTLLRLAGIEEDIARTRAEPLMALLK